MKENDPIEEVKNLLIDRFLLYGASLGVIILVISFYPINEIDYSFDFFSDIVGLSILYIVYGFKKVIPVKTKAGFVIAIVALLFTTDLIDNSIYSSDKVLLVVIPFLSILVYSLRTTIIIFSCSLFVYALIALFYIEGILEVPGYHASASRIVDWVNHISTVVLIAFIVTIFVYNFNESIHRFILDLEKTNHDLNVRDNLLEASLEEKNVMIQEIHHRVKNNLAVVSGLLELQSFHSENAEFRYILSKSTNRIMSIAKVHEMIYESDDFSNIPFHQYVQELSKIVASSINKDDKIINFDFNIQVESLNINHGVPLGIILNELITNSIKYGFSNSGDNKIAISVINKDELIQVTYEDNGIGIPNFDVAVQKSLGLTLIHSLLDQIDAKYEYDTSDKFKLAFTFPINQNNGPYQSESATQS